MTYVPVPKRGRTQSRLSICRHCELRIRLVFSVLAPAGHWIHEHDRSELCFPNETKLATPTDTAPRRRRR